MQKILQWWDGLELWIAGQGFFSQVVVMLLVMIPLAWMLAGVLEWAITSGQIRGNTVSSHSKPPLPKSWVSWSLLLLLVIVVVAWWVH